MVVFALNIFFFNSTQCFFFGGAGSGRWGVLPILLIVLCAFCKRSLLRYFFFFKFVNLSINMLTGLKSFSNARHCVKIFRSWSFSGPYFHPRKYQPKKLWIRTLFTQWKDYSLPLEPLEFCFSVYCLSCF